MFADVPHLVKLIRNNFIGFEFRNGEHVSDSAIREMLTLKKTDYCFAHKISEIHLNLGGQQRQWVKYAGHLLYESYSKALLYLGENGLLKSDDYRATSNLTKLVDDLFDLLNSSRK